MFLSAVITTYNRAEVLEKNLLEFAKQTDPDFEVVVAIDGSSDNTAEKLVQLKRELPFELRWVDTKEHSKYCLAKARNRGIIESRGDVVVILDDDSFPVPEFVEEHKKSAAWKTLTGGYRNSHDPNDSLHDKMRYLLENKISVNKATENNCAMYRKDWIGCGMFCEYIEGYGGVGQEFRLRLAYQGYDYEFNPKAMIYHHREFEGDNGLTREMKMAQYEENKKVVRKLWPSD